MEAASKFRLDARGCLAEQRCGLLLLERLLIGTGSSGLPGQANLSILVATWVLDFLDASQEPE